VTLDRIDYAPRDRERLLRALRGPMGLILLCGPAGCGKTTVLYSCLQHVARPEIKVVTIEDPVEYVYPWMVQSQVDPSEGVTFSRLARSALRSDADVIMIGELRDGETANLSLQASLCGHLVMSQLHANDAPRALVRLVEMGCPPFVIGDTTKLVMSQRLVRQLCPHCSRDAVIDPKRLARVEYLARTGGLDWGSLPKRFREAAGCDRCKHLGFRGRNIIAELLEVTPEIGAALRRGAAVDEMRAIAVGQGMTTMAADGVRKAADGKTSLEEVFRVLPVEAG
jgi:type II secretory ATPase GspE/PulE/Tfp pilus assembly ATPase PilB-like protein